MVFLVSFLFPSVSQAMAVLTVEFPAVLYVLYVLYCRFLYVINPSYLVLLIFLIH